MLPTNPPTGPTATPPYDGAPHALVPPPDANGHLEAAGDGNVSLLDIGDGVIAVLQFLCSW
jgi:hypothetical protein